MSDDERAFGFGKVFSEESRASLGLSKSEDVRVLARSGRVILLERGNGGGAAVPWDRDLVLSCDVRAFALADLLSLVHSAGKSGYLLFQYERQEKAVYLSRGEVVFAESNLPSDRLGACLLRAGSISQQQLELAESRYHPMTRFGKVLVEHGMLTPRDLWNGVKTQVEETVRSLFSYNAGWIHFWEGEIEPDNVVRLSLPTNRLIGEGLARRDDLLRFLAKLEDSRTHVRRGSAARTPSSENERALLSALTGDVGFSEICHRSGLDPRTAARSLQFLQLTGHVKVEQAGEDSETGDFTTADDDVVRESVSLHAKLIFELSAPLIALDGAAVVADRLNRIMEESAERGRTLLGGVRFEKSGTLDPEQLVFGALRLTGDRLREVDEALGEVISCIEFELQNHPRIDDCTPYLEAVDPLRAMLVR